MDPEQYENNLTLLGVTGLEDLLQENVKGCIKEFKEAKIKVWMLTGDKGETAETIGVSCGLLDPDEQAVFNIESAPKEKLLKNLQNIETSIRNKRGGSVTRTSPKNTVGATDDEKMAINNDMSPLKLSRRFSSGGKQL